jgi:hypothetical protein
VQVIGALSVLLIAAGAVLTFAVERQADGINLDAVGMILMVVGGIGLIASVMRGSMLGFNATRRRRVFPDGRTVVEQDRMSRFSPDRRRSAGQSQVAIGAGTPGRGPVSAARRSSRTRGGSRHFNDGKSVSRQRSVR